ncbi:CAP domain-containing protein [Wenxinia marina]|uniref:Cysteine-rich secretory protein family n=1 Tax=Wenxinia marina DSM 24838 TaxID=1123501 RepID=A0A0D0Q787_9RHOB|nr:CAP domain-containing protein [Wenxinia marina]KIQ68332.1 Cysteine-rich secretory protein family [Wenxinia marina DSM 24838]GGL73007.1 hypothetical protein GCM10011392_29570 [Wenxinia marina]
MKMTMIGAALSVALLGGCVTIGTTGGTGGQATATPVAEESVVVRPASAAFVQQSEATFNAIRAASGLGPVRFDPAPAAAAEVHARDMAVNGFRGHTGSDGSSFLARARRAGGSCAVAENITWGSSDVSGAFNWWQNSPQHASAMARRDVAAFGLAEVNRIWVLVMARC